ncbi:hypothetical protein HYU92_00625 [Candidatus Curtissbacteria bacterium]|nr:hypothetical protein [Candidatus Curtissbacteria bacterium]
MNLGITKLFKKAQPQENFLSLTITPDKVLATIWAFEGDNVKFLGFGQRPFQNADNLIHQAAIAIDTAGQKAKLDVTKTVYGLSQYWFEDGKLTDKTLKSLKNLSDDLELDPQAYISLAAAINHLLKIEESITPQALLLGLFSQPHNDSMFCEVHLIENNKVVATEISRLESSIERIRELIARLKQKDKDLPARLIVYGSNEELIQKLDKVDWQGLFVQEPKIDVLDNEEMSRSVAYAQAQDLLGREPTQESAIQETPTAAKTPKITSEFGFVKDEDILLAKKSEESDHKISTSEKLKPPEEPEEKNYAVDISDQNVITPEPSAPDLKEEIVNIGWLPRLLGVFKPSPKLIIAFIIFLFLVIAGAYFAAQAQTTAEVLIKVNAESVEKDFKVNINTEIIGQEIKGQSVSSQRAVATGTKKIGEYAKGDITILNWTKDPKTFSSGVVVITKSGVKFSLDSDVEVASRSASTPGQAKASVHALQFGTSSNITAGNDFTFQQFDELLYSAQNDANFTGGDERQITVVSEEDIANLEKSLTDLLIGKAKNNLKEKVQGFKLHDHAQLVKIIKKEFDKKLAEEASLINLNMEVEVSAIVYSQDDLKKYLAALASKEAPTKVVRPEDIEIIDENAQITSSRSQNSLTLSGKFRARLVPKFEDAQLKDKIAGKSVKDARSIIRSLPDVADVQVKFFPNLPLVDSIPQNKSNIKFKIE